MIKTMQHSLGSSILPKHGEQTVNTLAARYAQTIMLNQCNFSLLRARQSGAVKVRGMAMPRRAKSGKVGPSYGGEFVEETDEVKRERRLAFMSEVNRKYGAGTLSFLSQSPRAANVSTFSTGALTLDCALGGGFPYGRVIELFGTESSGKTTLALHTIAEMQKRGGTVFLLDAENSLDQQYAAKIGVDVDSLICCQIEEMEKALQLVDETIRQRLCSLVVIDSLPALIPQAELTSDIGMSALGPQARTMSIALRKLVNSASAAKCTILILNQLRQKINVTSYGGSPDITPGGNALKYYSSVRLDLRVVERISASKASIAATPNGALGFNTGDLVGVRVRAKVAKSKISAPFQEAFFNIYFGQGISKTQCLIEQGEKMGLVVRKGAWYSYKDILKEQGLDRAAFFLAENPDFAEMLELDIRSLLPGGSQAGMVPNASSATPDDDEMIMSDEEYNDYGDEEEDALLGVQ